MTLAQFCEHIKNRWIVYFIRIDFTACEVLLNKAVSLSCQGRQSKQGGISETCLTMTL